MNHIKALHIKGFKKFVSLDMEFNEHMNILVGENEAGKSTILEAIKIVLNQQYRNADKSILVDLFNADSVLNFEKSPCIRNLPQIIIDLELELDPKSRYSEYFYGEAYGSITKNISKYGIRFECKYDELLGTGMEQSILDGKIPYEYYTFSWFTYANSPYQMVRRPLRFLEINTTSNNATSTFNYYNRALFTSRYDEPTKVKAKNVFRTKLTESFGETELPELGDNRKFGIDAKKVVLESILSVYEDNIALENRGKGMESLIKTEIALSRANGLDVIMIEEPECHLSFTTLRKMLKGISDSQESSQIIVTTHDSMIASRLNLRHVLWIADVGVKSLTTVSNDVAEFFVKADDNSFLQLLLSKKVFLVEGATEYLLIPYFYEQLTGHTIENDEVTMISCNGISYKKYLEIAEKTGKRLAAITDNDGKEDRISRADDFNSTHDQQHIFMGKTVEDWTWEACIYNINKDTLDEMITVRSGANYKVHNTVYEPVLGKMLNSKVDTAYSMLQSNEKFNIPEYVRSAIEWLRQ